MSETNTQFQQVATAVEKAIADGSSRYEVAITEANKLQTKGVAQAGELIESASRVAREQLAFAEQINGEWRKLVLAATRKATELFAPKA